MAFPNNNYPRNNGGQRGFQPEPPKPVFDVKTLNQTNYVSWAEKVILEHRKTNDRDCITVTQLRSLYALLTEVREILRINPQKEMSDKLVSQIQYIKMRFVYAAGRGRDNSSKNKDGKGVYQFLLQAGMISEKNESCFELIGNSSEKFELVCKYMEALVAYHKFYINK